ncbi:hypothetical protein ACFIQG_21770 [Comamonas odontotermitis]|uniref:hypothetical protein n=1 Tax=Comamonas odontotermitis TaxID=379895 RepID=UPI003670D2AC
MQVNSKIQWMRAVLVWVFFAALLPAWALAQTADLQINKAGPATASGGDNVTYTLTLNNNGPDSADGASFTDTLPAGLNNVAATCLSAINGAVCPTSMTVSNTSVSGTISTFPDLGKVVIQITGRFPVSGASSLTNTAKINAPSGVTDPDTASNTSVVSTAMSYRADVTVTKMQSSSILVSGQPITYTMTVTNNGPNPADGANINDLFSTLPYISANLVFNSCTTAGGAVCPANSNFNSLTTNSSTWLFNTNIPNLPVGGSITIIYTMTPTVGTQACGSTANTIWNRMTGNSPPGVTDPNTGNNTVTVSIPTPAGPPCPQADLVVTKTQSSSTLVSGQPITYTMTVTNNGLNPADGANINDLFSTLSYISANLVFNSCTTAGGAVCPANSNFNSLTTNSSTWLFNTNIPNLPVGGSITIIYTMTPTVGTLACGTSTNTIWNRMTGNPPPGVTDPNTGNNTATVSISTPAGPPCPQADLVVTKTQSPSVFTVGVPITYTMVLTNNGPSAADGSNITDLISTSQNIKLDAVFSGCTATGGAVCPAFSNTTTSSSAWLFMPNVPSRPCKTPSPAPAIASRRV